MDLRDDNAGKSALNNFLRETGADSFPLADRSRGALLGLMLGDALGMPLEFSKRDTKHVSDLEKGGPFNLERGYWTDDSSLAFCTAYSLSKCVGFDARHMMECYSLWYRYGAFSSTEECFDIGNATRQAIENYLRTGEPYSGSAHPKTAGNGSLMRLAPIPIFYSDDFQRTVHFAAESSKLTHKAVEAVDACRYFAALLYGALNGESKGKILDGLYAPAPDYWDQHPLTPSVKKIALGSYKNKSRDQISSSGYVIDTLEAALWAFYRNDDFRSGALEAVNLANDSDTVGAVYGQLAGAFYGEMELPFDWIRKLYKLQAAYHFPQDLLQAKTENARHVEAAAAAD
ncbi:ADP-ribosylglycohydrolase family protein [Duganella sp. CF517]|uniref:ADP-ribosylglycohydrolase family protein n=1 Tax=Duganella sp. CF517 TaxID=1881038 RepID=UPI001C430447|nr:ADP-ribosylglycohydrolase family protein [Duganella sp. CF517]